MTGVKRSYRELIKTSVPGLPIKKANRNACAKRENASVDLEAMDNQAHQTEQSNDDHKNQY